MLGQNFNQFLNNQVAQRLSGVLPAVGTGLKKAAPYAAGAGVLTLGGIGLGKLIDTVGGENLAKGETITSGSPGTRNDAQNIELISKLYGLDFQQAQKILPLYEAAQEGNLRRSMEATRQVGQITGDLARQKYGYQLAGNAMNAGQGYLSTLMSNPNPYAQTGLSGTTNLSL